MPGYPRLEDIMLNKQWALVLVAVGAVTACQIDFGDDAPEPRGRHGARADHAAAREAIWNRSVGDPAVFEFAERVERLNPSIVGDRIKDRAPRPAGLHPGPVPESPATKRSLILYDRSGDWGALGELYAIGTANLASRFGAWTAKPVTTYVCGEIASYDATLYIGSSYFEEVPACLLDDTLATTRPVIWSYYHIWKLAERIGPAAFQDRFGFGLTTFDTSDFGSVEYKGRTINRYAANPGGLFGTAIVDATRAQVLANAVRADGSKLPWALRSGHLTYVADIPFTYMTEEDRYLVFADLLFDALAPNTTERHRALLRIEDISPVDDPQQLRAIADYLYSQNVPFGFGVVSEYRDPLGYYNGGTSKTVRLAQAPAVVEALKYMMSKGGVPIMHGYTHQRDTLLNPYTAVSGDDTEFYRVVENADHTVTHVGPLPQDTIKSSRDRIDSATTNFKRAGLPPPTLYEFPHYAASANAYRASAERFTTRWERSLYFPGVLSGETVDYRYLFGQLFPYPVRDVYGMRVLPENLGNIEPEPFYSYPVRLPADIVNAAEKNLVVRDGVVGFYFHPFFDLQYLRETVQGIQALGYTFVCPNEL
jgi:uncharacterized protein YdaL